MTHRTYNLPSLFFILTLVICSVSEVVLLEVKYEFFTGGFLQSHQLDTLPRKIGFILIFLSSNIILYGGIYKVWRYILERFRINRSIAAFHFMMISGIVTAFTLVVQFQLHKYFADAMDAALIKKIAGGNIKTALVYAMDELLLLIAGLSALIFTYYLIYKFSKKYIIKYHDNTEIKVTDRSIVKNILTALLVAAVTSVLVYVVNGNELLRYNLVRGNSYSLITTALNHISDFDGDGYGSFRYPKDNKIFESDIYPGALDIPNNGVDEDGFFGDFKSPVSLYDYEVKNVGLRNAKHIVILMMESTRADIVDKKIDGELVAPNISALAKTGQSIEEAYSHTGYTATSIASFFSGRIGEFGIDKSIFHELDSLGYEIAIFSGQDESWGRLDELLGTRDYADEFFDAQTGVDERVFPSKLPSSIKLSEKTLWERFERYSRGADWNKPQFVYFNMQAGHFPYFHGKMMMKFVETGIPRSEISVTNRTWLERTYWNAMSHADHYIGLIINELMERGIWEETLLIISGDHGEELFDDNHLGHGFFLSDVQTRIPLVISQRELEIEQPTGHSDMKNLILSYALDHVTRIDERRENEEKSVFQMTGDLKDPGKIALRYKGEKQITIDFKKMLVRPLGETTWITYDNALEDEEVKSELKILINHWENLRWQSYLEGNASTRSM